MTNPLFLAAAVVLTPFAGGLIAGLDRKITARLQGRFGPPVLQPFYDVFKLFGKQGTAINVWQVFCSYAYAVSALLSMILLVLGSDLLLIFFILTMGGAFLVMGALAAPSPYSQVGAHRELVLMLIYEPVLILAFAGIFMVTGSFEASSIWALDRPLLLELPLIFIALTYALTIKLRKSPFDISTSHHMHQELVRGVLTEYSGPFLALVEIGHWFEVVFLLILCGMFWSTSWVGMAVVIGGTYLLELLLDNVTARLTWRWMLKYVWAVTLLLAVANLAMLSWL